MKRLFSVPGLRWRGRIKEFERDVYDGWADRFDRSIWTAWCNRWVEGFAKEIPEGNAILDIGCGTGNAPRILAARQPIRLAGIDISSIALRGCCGKPFGCSNREDSSSSRNRVSHFPCGN